MKLGELFIEMGIVGDVKPLKEALKGMENAEKKNKRLVQYKKDLKKATTEEEKVLIKKNFAQEISTRRTIASTKATFGLLGQLVKVASAVGVAVLAFDRMANAMFKANQQMITFQRQTGISFASLNKYASASSAVNYNATLEGTAQTMQSIAQNLWEIRMGRGDISPFQELGLVGGKSINPFGKTTEQVIEEVREGIKGVNDIQATNIITRMGFSPEDLLMLRMTKKEFEDIQSLFLNKKEQEALNQYALRMKKIHLQMSLVYQQIMLKLMPAFVKFMDFIRQRTQVLGNFIKKIADLSDKLKITKGIISVLELGVIGLATAISVKLVAGLMKAVKAIQLLLFANPKIALLVAGLTALALILDDIMVSYMGGKSLLDWKNADGKKVEFGASGVGNKKSVGERAKEIESLKNRQMFITAPPKVPNLFNNINKSMTQNNNINVQTSQATQAISNEMPFLTSNLQTIMLENFA